MENLKGKNAIVTGGTRGIGLAITRSLLEKGVKVLFCARKPDDVEKALGNLRSSFDGQIYGQACDVSKADQVQELFEKVDRELGGVDLLINNAGVGLFKNAEATS